MLLNVLLILLPLVIGYLVPLLCPFDQAGQSVAGQDGLSHFVPDGAGARLRGEPEQQSGGDLQGGRGDARRHYPVQLAGPLVAGQALAPTHEASDGPMPSKLHLLWESLQLCFVVLGGVLLGLLVDLRALPIDKWSEWALMLLLFLIGVQMRNSGMRLRQILLNPWGMKIAVTVILSSWLGSLLAAQLLGMPLTHGLALSSSFGWYSLSGILVADKLGPVLGSAAFINDLGRELIAILIIPILMRRHPSAAIGYGGATALDFTLPVIQKSGGIQVVPVAIVSGFILSLFGPILILGFLAI